MNNFEYNWKSKSVEFDELSGLVLISITGLEKDSDEVLISTECGREFKMYHEQDCCECVTIDDICGDVSDVVGTTIIKAEERESEANDDEVSECGTWTFYDIQTVKGSVNIKWLGESNGYYSESVSLIEGTKVEECQ